MPYTLWRKRNIKRNLPRQILALVLLIITIGLLIQLAPRLINAQQLAVDDFVQYWSAGRLIASGQNPYSPELLAPLQLGAGRSRDVPVMMWCPPWTLPLILPFGILPFFYSRLLWFLVNIVITFLCANWAWDYIGGPPNKRWIGWLAAFAFEPCLQAIAVGQIIPFLLLSVMGFLYFERRQKLWLAGFFLALAAIKPHTLFLFILAALLWTVSNRKWQVIAGAVFALLSSSLVAILLDPAIISQYLFAALHNPPQQFATATLGGGLRLLFGSDIIWLQFLPSLFGAAWLIAYWYQRRNNWEWKDNASIVLLISLTTAAYGWLYDMQVLMVALLEVAEWIWQSKQKVKSFWIYLPYVIINLVIMIPISQVYFFWTAGTLTIWYIAAKRVLQPYKDMGELSLAVTLS